EDNRSGVWMVFPDDFEEGDLEYDATIVAPTALFQPERGFGKLWRDNPDVREALGWAEQAEIGYVSVYEYQPGGELYDDGYEAGPGYHLVGSGLNPNRTYRFNEINGTWQALRAGQ
ncbi:MAG: hypothetical protein H7Y11_11540, partial [Armatimonadetes bacterium]|nr:hypothetical protein [Anaerolineae bacterium]